MRLTTVVAVLGLTLIVTLGLTLGLNAQSQEFKPPRMAFVDIHNVIENYARSRQVEETLKKKAEDLQTHLEDAMLEIQKQEAKLESLSRDSRQYKDGRRVVEIAKFRLQYEGKEAEREVRREARDEMSSIYQEILDAVERYAKAMGLEVVLLMSSGEIPGESLPELKFQIAVRPVLYVADGLNVTKPILSILNSK